jgi:hypothetical protein
MSAFFFAAINDFLRPSHHSREKTRGNYLHSSAFDGPQVRCIKLLRNVVLEHGVPEGKLYKRLVKDNSDETDTSRVVK